MDLGAVINVAFSLCFFLVLNLAAALCIYNKEYRVLTALGRWILRSQTREMCIFEASYLYLVLSLVFLIGTIDPSSYGFILLVGLGGAIAILGDVYIRRRNSASSETIGAHRNRQREVERNMNLFEIRGRW
jgi:hypothetical protein